MNYFLATLQIYLTYVYPNVKYGFLFLNQSDILLGLTAKRKSKSGLILPLSSVISFSLHVFYLKSNVLIVIFWDSFLNIALIFILTSHNFCCSRDLNPNTPTSLPNIKVAKLLHIKTMAENIPDGFPSGSQIIRNPLLRTRNILPHKRSPLAPSTIRQHKQPHALFTSDISPQILELDLISL